MPQTISRFKRECNCGRHSDHSSGPGSVLVDTANREDYFDVSAASSAGQGLAPLGRSGPAGADQRPLSHARRPDRSPSRIAGEWPSAPMNRPRSCCPAAPSRSSPPRSPRRPIAFRPSVRGRRNGYRTERTWAAPFRPTPRSSIVDSPPGWIGPARRAKLTTRSRLPASIKGQQSGDYAMRTDLSRRDFLAVSAAGVSLAATGGRAAEPAYKTTLHKAVILRGPDERGDVQEAQGRGHRGLRGLHGSRRPGEAGPGVGREIRFADPLGDGRRLGSRSTCRPGLRRRRRARPGGRL